MNTKRLKFKVTMNTKRLKFKTTVNTKKKFKTRLNLNGHVLQVTSLFLAPLPDIGPTRAALLAPFQSSDQNWVLFSAIAVLRSTADRKEKHSQLQNSLLSHRYEKMLHCRQEKWTPILLPFTPSWDTGFSKWKYQGSVFLEFKWHAVTGNWKKEKRFHIFSHCLHCFHFWLQHVCFS